MKITVGSKQAEVRKLELKRSDIICIKRPKGTTDDDFTTLLNMFADDVASYIGFRNIVIGIDRTWNDITKLDKEQMRLYGWVPVDDVLAMKGDPIDMVWEQVKELEDFAKIDEILKEANEKVDEEE